MTLQPRIAYLHIGTHKTGTTSVQAFLAANEASFGASGIFLPKAGRVQPEFAAQHNVAWELTGDWTYDPGRGTFNELLAEVSSSKMPAVCISSEEFDRLHLHPDALTRFASGFRRIGYEPRIVVYLRSQADYAESLYAELVRADHKLSFAQLIEGIVGTVRTYAPRFEYLEMLHEFAAVFGRRAITVRAYQSGAATDAILRDFTSIVGGKTGGPVFASLQLPPRLNERQKFGDVFAKIMSGGEQPAANASHIASGIFDPLTPGDILRIARRFTRPNAHIKKLYGVRIATISAVRLRCEVRAAIGLDLDARRRKRWFKITREKIPGAGSAS